MSGLVWDFQSAARISRVVRKVEQTGQSQFDEMGFASNLGGSRDWVKTPSTLPGGYDGTEPLDGVKVVRLPDGTIHEHPQSVFILDPNGTALAADTIYPAQFAGTYDDGSTIQGLYLVQAGGSGTGSGLVVGYYNGGNVNQTGGTGTTTITVNGEPKTIAYNPWGFDANISWLHLGDNLPPLGSSRFAVILRDTNSGTTNYSLIPFSRPCVVKFSHANPNRVVLAKTTNSYSYGYGFYATDPLGIVPNFGEYRAVVTNWPTNIMLPDFTLRTCGFMVVSVNTANPVSAGSGVSLSGAAFPSGMGGAFPGPKTTNLNGVE
jgi:hypothetical protein